MLRRILRAACACLCIAPGLLQASKPGLNITHSGLGSPEPVGRLVTFQVATSKGTEKTSYRAPGPVINTSSIYASGFELQTWHLTFMSNRQERAIALSSINAKSKKQALEYGRKSARFNPAQRPWQEAR